MYIHALSLAGTYGTAALGIRIQIILLGLKVDLASWVQRAAIHDCRSCYRAVSLNRQSYENTAHILGYR